MSTSKQHKEELRRLFGDLPVVEATTQLLMVASKQDADGAVREDPENCFFARACRRLFESEAVAFFRSVAYVDLPAGRGRRVLARFKLPPATRAQIERFDLLGEIDPAGYVLLPPPPSDTLDGKREARIRVLSGSRKRKVLRGKMVAPSPPKRSPKIQMQSARKATTPVADPPCPCLRSGVGQVHFTAQKTPGVSNDHPKANRRRPRAG